MSKKYPNDPKPGKTLKVWVVDPLEKIFRDTPCPAKPQRVVSLEAARGETVSAQVALRAENIARHGFGVDAVIAEPLRKTGVKPIPLERRWVGYTFVGKSAPGVDAENLEGSAPGLYPDPLYPVYEPRTNPHHFNPDHSVALGNQRTQALWLTVRVPRSATPGEYSGVVRLQLAFYGKEIVVPVKLKVYPATLPAKPVCGIENWFVLASVTRHHQCEWWSKRFWDLTEAYLRNLADHRQTHIVVPMFELIEFTAGAGNKLRIGWKRFDRFIRMALDAGLTCLSGNHLATYTYEIDRRFLCGVHTFKVDGKKVCYELHNGASPQAQEWLAWFLPRLRNHLREKGWLNRWWQHVRDEPSPDIIEDYLAIHAAVKKYAPEFRTIEALHGPRVEQCDCWVPALDALGRNLEFFRKRMEAGDKVWTYVCCAPTGKYANRFVDQRTVLCRLIFWIMARYGATGYLHWGYNWSDQAVSEIDTTWFLPAQGPTPAGDVTIVYPGPHGPHDSIRWEQQREGAQDYELLQLLARRDPKAAKRIVCRLIKDFDKYNVSAKAFRLARRMLLKALD